MQGSFRSVRGLQTEVGENEEQTVIASASRQIDLTTMIRKPNHSAEGNAASCRRGLGHKAVLGNRKRNPAKGRFLLGKAEQNLKGINTEWAGVLT